MMPATVPSEPRQAAAIKIRNVTLRLGKLSLFENLTADFAAGQATCLLGSSGVGKTSLLKAVAGLIACENGGTITDQGGLPLTGQIAYMAQQDLLLPWLSVLENVTLGSRFRREPAPRTEAFHLLERVGLADYANARPSELSGGMRQRAALSRTLIEQRPVVLLDEPFAALDAVTRARLQELAAELLAGRTLLLVTHDPLEALRIGDAVRVLHGRPAQLDPPISPPGQPPRSFTDSSVLKLQAELMTDLLETS